MSAAADIGVPTEPTYAGNGFAYDRWMNSLGVPLYTGFYIEDLRGLELGWWDERGCDTAFIQLRGQEGVSEARVSEIPAGKSLPPQRLAIDELVYVLEGSGVTTFVSPSGGSRVVEWHEHSLILLHRGWQYTHGNADGRRRARLLNFNYLPIAMSVLPDTGFLFNPPESVAKVLSESRYGAPQMGESDRLSRTFGKRTFWYGDFFPDMSAWDSLEANVKRGAGGKTVFMGFPGSEMTCHMSAFPARTYKRAHRHGPGRVIVIPAGQGFSVLWQGEDDEKVVAPWHEGSMLVPPDRWFHQHFNTGRAPARYLALHPARQFSGHSEKPEDRARDQIDYTAEDPWIREKFEADLAKNGVTSLMPPEAYEIPDYVWSQDAKV